jgi:pimeloyl-ACP methyl ester carboxylesterase
VRFDYRGHGASSGEFLDTTLGDWWANPVAANNRDPACSACHRVSHIDLESHTAERICKHPCQSPWAACRYEDTLQVIDNVALPGQHIIVGSSIGAWIALKAAAARRERIRVQKAQATNSNCSCVPVPLCNIQLLYAH